MYCIIPYFSWLASPIAATETSCFLCLGRQNIGEAAMERNATACAMEWSIELEKALRSKIPGE